MTYLRKRNIERVGFLDTQKEKQYECVEDSKKRQKDSLVVIVQKVV